MGSTARPTRTGSAVRRRGFTYLGLMLIVASMGAALAATAQVWATVVQREKEVELLFIGEEFRKALKGFAAAARNSNEHAPRTLNDLIKDCLLYTSDAADERSSVDLGGRRIIKKKTHPPPPHHPPPPPL